MERTYFAWVKLTDGRFVNLVYTSAQRKGSWGNVSDLLHQADGKADIDMPHYTRKQLYHGNYCNVIDMYDSIHLLNKKNMDEECFDEYETIDLR